MLDLLKIKEEFSSLVLDTQPWTLAQFVMWLDLKLSEYKIRGFMVLDHQKKTKPRWLLDTTDDTDRDSDTAPLPPPCRKPCCWTERADPSNHHDNRKGSSHDFLSDYQDAIPDANKCIVDLSDASLNAQRAKQKEDNSSKISQSKINRSDSVIEPSAISSRAMDCEVIQIPDNNFRLGSASSSLQQPIPSQPVTRISHSASANHSDSIVVKKVTPSERKHSTPSATITQPPRLSPVKSMASQQRSFPSPHFPSTQQQISVRPLSMETQSPSHTEIPASQGPVPVALHAVSSESPGQLMYPKDGGQGTIRGISPSDLQIVQQIKHELNTGDVEIISDELAPDPGFLYGDLSHISSDDDTNLSRGQVTDQGWLQGQSQPMTFKPISEQARNVELPRFEDPLVRRVLEDTAPPSRHMWSKIITRCAYHMLSKGVPHKHDYQIFAEAFYHRYPCIGTNRGPNPWSRFAATVSQKVRNERRRHFDKRDPSGAAFHKQDNLPSNSDAENCENDKITDGFNLFDKESSA